MSSLGKLFTCQAFPGYSSAHKEGRNIMTLFSSHPEPGGASPRSGEDDQEEDDGFQAGRRVEMTSTSAGLTSNHDRCGLRARLPFRSGTEWPRGRKARGFYPRANWMVSTQRRIGERKAVGTHSLGVCGTGKMVLAREGNVPLLRVLYIEFGFLFLPSGK